MLNHKYLKTEIHISIHLCEKTRFRGSFGYLFI